jgi:hypothetical protein
MSFAFGRTEAATKEYPMSNALTLFDSPTFAIPAHLQDLNEEGNIADRQTTPSLSYEGKVWTISVNGEKTKLMKRDADGDEMPLAVMRVVILDYNQRRGRSYYEGAYDPAKAAQPLCWSDDGVAPSPAVKSPQCASCDACPMAVKGSKVTEQGKAVSACSQHRMLAVVPANKMDMEPLRIKLAVTSDYDKDNDLEAQGWFAFQQYRDFLKARNINHTAMLVTKMRFDPNTAYPKVLFSPDRWVEPNEKPIINPKAKSDAVKKLLSGTWTPAGVEGEKITEDDAPMPAKLSEQAKAKAPPKTEKPKAEKPKAAPQVLDDDDDDVPAPKAAAKAEKPKAAPQILDDDDDEIVVKSSTKAAAPAAAADLPDDVAALLGEWGDD